MAQPDLQQFTSSSASLARVVGVRGTVLMGLGSILGTGIGLCHALVSSLPRLR